MLIFEDENGVWDILLITNKHYRCNNNKNQRFEDVAVRSIMFCINSHNRTLEKLWIIKHQTGILALISKIGFEMVQEMKSNIIMISVIGLSDEDIVGILTEWIKKDNYENLSAIAFILEESDNQKPSRFEKLNDALGTTIFQEFFQNIRAWFAKCLSESWFSGYLLSPFETKYFIFK
ncbi:unnamed protein product [Caenorhabditis angaria]|uniref:Uncharacterized protein n=1 Tax=Caenorhabditis angaria TaxID=860376 RepID=A0A9P1J332_9PELO|nr:unnamed protein product [Caenorhabditis angaria]